jgi:phosphohistidine phosphatase
MDMITHETADTIAIIGHNPGVGMLANRLVTAPPDHHRFGDYPTCATTVIDFAIDAWSEAKNQSGKCQDFVVPRDLIGTDIE